MSYKEEYKKWCEEDIFDEETKKELLSIKDNEKEIEDRFYKELEFGTAGLRGVMGAGLNRMNKYTVGKATQGLANYINNSKKDNKKVAISYDSRNNSKEFAEVTALILNANGITTYLFEKLSPVPELAFAVRELGCIAGVMITASHNPPKYNGYKVYNEDGAQVTSPIDKDIMDEVKKINDFAEIKTMDKNEAILNGLYNVVGSEIDNRFIEEIKKLLLNADIIENQKDLGIVYTPLHGAGNYLAQKVLREIGFTNVHVVPEQEQPDGNFPTVEFPNPEDKNAFKLAIELAKKVNAEIVLANDPDADRLGVYVKNNDSFIPLTGNMSALLILEYILSQKKERGILPENSIVLQSIVSSRMADPITKAYGVKLEEVLIGFKYFGDKIKQFEENKDYNYVFGYEESYGCLMGTYVRDKDGIAAIMMLCEVAAYYKEKGISLWEQMINIYNKYGYYKEETKSITMEGIDGLEKIANKMAYLKENALTQIGSYKVKKIRDYSKQIVKNLENNTEEKIELPISNIVYYELENDAWVCVRPSGNEPKIKYYIGVKGNSFEDADRQIELIEKFIKEEM